MPSVDLQRLTKLKDDGLISIQKHPEFPLLIHNYTQRCQFSRAWDDLTIQCRGLITDLEGAIVARPFPKFFNLGEHKGEDAKLPPINWKQDFIATRKLDGSLGVLYFGDGPLIATRGSFTSDQAKRGTEILIDKGYHLYPYSRALTYLFEIIYPENRIVVDYGGQTDLILLDVLDIETGKGRPYGELREIAQAIGCPVVPDIGFGDVELQAALADFAKKNEPNEEGIVVRFDDGMRIKVKFDEYCRLHKLITGVNARHIWENLMHGANMDDLLDRVPDEFFDWVQKTKAELLDKFEEIKADANYYFDSTHAETRKEFAEAFLKPECKHLSGILFAMLDGRPYDNYIWKMIKPDFSPPFKDDEA